MYCRTPGAVRSPALETPAMISLRYGASVVATTPSKALGVHWSVLTVVAVSKLAFLRCVHLILLDLALGTCDWL